MVRLRMSFTSLGRKRYRLDFSRYLHGGANAASDRIRDRVPDPVAGSCPFRISVFRATLSHPTLSPPPHTLHSPRNHVFAVRRLGTLGTLDDLRDLGGRRVGRHVGDS